jgi:16S rRNA G1207 methylase RsmC
MPIDSVMKHYKEKFSLIRKIIAKENPTIIEVGAHYGEDSMRFLETFPKAKIYCFEPDPRNVRAFRAYIDNPQIQLFEVALAAQNGTASFFQLPESCHPGGAFQI